MWTCPECGRNFQRPRQTHSCKSVPLEDHFKEKVFARGIFDILVKKIEKQIGKTQIVSIPCCVHLFGTYDFLAALPKKDSLEIRFGLERSLNSQRMREVVKLSAHGFKNCLELKSAKDINIELMNWLKESYHLKDDNT